MLTRLQIQCVGLGIGLPLLRYVYLQRALDLLHDIAGNLILNLKNIFQRAIEIP